MVLLYASWRSLKKKKRRREEESEILVFEIRRKKSVIVRSSRSKLHTKSIVISTLCFIII